MSELKGAYGNCVMVRKVPSRGVSQIVIEIPVEYHVAATTLLDGRDVWTEEVPPDIAAVGRYCVINGVPVPVQQAGAPVATPKPYGDPAKLLYEAGFWFVPAVLAAIGTDAEYRAWIQNQPCIACGGGDFVEATGELLCEAAHVKRPSNSGMHHKPEYSCVPLCHDCHINVQHARGLPELYLKHCKRIGGRPRTQWNPLGEDAVVESELTAKEAREWFDRERDKHLLEWATTTISAQLGAESTGYIAPVALVAWAQSKGVAQYLPATYRKAAT